MPPVALHASIRPIGLSPAEATPRADGQTGQSRTKQTATLRFDSTPPPVAVAAAHQSVYGWAARGAGLEPLCAARPVADPAVKRRDLERRLRALGWRFRRHGANHDLWSNGAREEAIPRHSEVNEKLAAAILRRAART